MPETEEQAHRRVSLWMQRRLSCQFYFVTMFALRCPGSSISIATRDRNAALGGRILAADATTSITVPDSGVSDLKWSKEDPVVAPTNASNSGVVEYVVKPIPAGSRGEYIVEVSLPVREIVLGYVERPCATTSDKEPPKTVERDKGPQQASLWTKRRSDALAAAADGTPKQVAPT